MSKAITSPLSIVQDNSGISWHKDQGFRAYLDHGPRVYSPVQENDLLAIHPWLPELIKHLCRGYRPGKDAVHITSIQLLANLAQWSEPAPVMIDTDGYSYHLTKLRNCRIEPGDIHVELDVYVNEMEDWWAPDDIQPTKIVMDPTVVKIQVYKLWLDAKFPGWHERYLDGITLGIGPAEMIKHMFNKQKPEYDVSISGLTFE